MSSLQVGSNMRLKELLKYLSLNVSQPANIVRYKSYVSNDFKQKVISCGIASYEFKQTNLW